jgi:hypothetical protein
MDSSFGIIKGVIASTIAFIFALVVVVKMGVVDVGFGSYSPNSENSFEQRNIARNMTAALKESLPVYANHLITERNLSAEQIDSLRALYLPLIEEYIKTGEKSLIEKANLSKMLILNEKISVSKIEAS